MDPTPSQQQARAISTVKQSIGCKYKKKNLYLCRYQFEGIAHPGCLDFWEAYVNNKIFPARRSSVPRGIASYNNKLLVIILIDFFKN